MSKQRKVHIDGNVALRRVTTCRVSDNSSFLCSIDYHIEIGPEFLVGHYDIDDPNLLKELDLVYRRVERNIIKSLASPAL